VSEHHTGRSVVTSLDGGSASNDVVDDAGSFDVLGFDVDAAAVVDVAGAVDVVGEVGAVGVKVLTLRRTTLLQVERVSSGRSLGDVRDRTLKYLRLGRPSAKAQVSASDTMNDEALAKSSDSEPHTSQHIGLHSVSTCTESFPFPKLDR
jgi:hypothetical protein